MPATPTSYNGRPIAPSCVRSATLFGGGNIAGSAETTKICPLPVIFAATLDGDYAGEE